MELFKGAFSYKLWNLLKWNLMSNVIRIDASNWKLCLRSQTHHACHKHCVDILLRTTWTFHVAPALRASNNYTISLSSGIHVITTRRMSSPQRSRRRFFSALLFPLRTTSHMHSHQVDVQLGVTANSSDSLTFGCGVVKKAINTTRGWSMLLGARRTKREIIELIGRPHYQMLFVFTFSLVAN